MEVKEGDEHIVYLQAVGNWGGGILLPLGPVYSAKFSSNFAGPPVDIFFLIDTSGSFSSDLVVLQNEIEGIISNLLSANSNTRFGLGSFEDDPLRDYGYSGCEAHRRLLDITEDAEAIISAVKSLVTKSGGDYKESQLTASLQAATGNGQIVELEGGETYTIPAAQNANFCTNAAKIMIMWTDAPFHNSDDIDDQKYPSPGLLEVIDALTLAPPSPGKQRHLSGTFSISSSMVIGGS